MVIYKHLIKKLAFFWEVERLCLNFSFIGVHYLVDLNFLIKYSGKGRGDEGYWQGLMEV